MQLFSPLTSHNQLLRSRDPNPNVSKSVPKFPSNHSVLKLPPRSSTASSSAAAPLQRKQPTPVSSGSDSGEDSDGFISVRRPMKGEARMSEAEEVDDDVEVDVEEEEEEEVEIEEEEEGGLDKGLSSFAKRMPMFEPPERVEVGAEGKPLGVNLELWLYRAKVLGRKFMFRDAEKLLRKCISFWPEDGRAYVALGKILGKQSKFSEARLVYETGCQATQGENPYIWQCWAVLENKLGNARRARELFDAATVADEKHVAAWHGWAVLEIKQGNLTKARNLLGKGLKCCGKNEYIYQTLALLEVKANRVEQARYLFQRATSCNSKSCASWLAWAQLETQQENKQLSRKLFEKAVQASPKNRYAWHVWALFEASQGDVDKARKLLKIGHTLNPRDPVLLQSLALLEYKHSSSNLARVLFRRASKLDPRHQPIWMAWGWMEWKEGNITTAKELYQKALSIDSTSETAARCLQAWGVLEQRLGNLSAARRLFRSSLNINSQSYVTWMTWASFEEEQGNVIRAEEIRNLYFQQRTEVVDDASWVMGFLDVIDPAVARIKRFLNFDQDQNKMQDTIRKIQSASDVSLQESENSPSAPRDGDVIGSEDESTEARMGEDQAEANLTSDFDLDSFIKDKLSLDAAKLDILMDTSSSKKNLSSKRVWRSDKATASAQP